MKSDVLPIAGGVTAFLGLGQGAFNARFAGMKAGDRLLKRAGAGLPERV